MSKIIEQAHDNAVDPNGKAYIRDTVTAADGERLEIPTEMQGKQCWFAAEQYDVWIRFGDGTVDVDQDTVSALATETLTAGPKAPHLHIPAGQERHKRVQGTWTHFAHISRTAAGKFRFGNATGDGTNSD